MHKKTIILPLVSLALGVKAQGTTSTIPVPEYISYIYGGSPPATITGAVATSLAEAIQSFMSEAVTDSAFLSAQNVVASAAQHASDRTVAYSEFSSAGVLNAAAMTTADWYVSGVPNAAKTELAKVIGEFQSVATSVLDSAGKTSTGGVFAVKPTGGAVAGLAATVAFGAAVAL
ncbi:hypothetical protein BX600DRAFT_475780 [Xylariales sp. PMI_506]|nr:hypothetical protein BX600DRAFT_475780 [Xylariales sp. PMI_506]